MDRKTKDQRNSTRNTYRHRNTYIGTHRNPLKIKLLETIKYINKRPVGQESEEDKEKGWGWGRRGEEEEEAQTKYYGTKIPLSPSWLSEHRDLHWGWGRASRKGISV